MECRFRKTIATKCLVENIMQTIKASIRSATDKLFDVLSDHSDAHQMILLDRIETAFVTVRLHNFANVKNARFRQACSRSALHKWITHL